MELEQFDPSNYKPDYTIFILGGKDSGKTTLIRKMTQDHINLIFTHSSHKYDTKDIMFYL